MKSIRQSENYARYMESLGWIVEKAGATNVFVRKLPFFSFFSVIKVQRFDEIDTDVLKKIAKKYHPILTKLEPRTQNLVPSGFRRDSWPLSPTKTLGLDLKNINLPKDTRYEIRKANKNGLFIRSPLASQGETLINDFYRLLQETMKIGHWSVPIHKEVTNLYRAFQPNNSAILLCHSGFAPESIEMDPGFRREDNIVAGCLLVWYGDTAHYMYAANTRLGRELGGAYFTLWEAIKFCQKKGLKYLDLEGIYDERYAKSTKNWQGFTKFKMGWGGKVREYPGSWTNYPWFKFLKWLR